MKHVLSSTATTDFFSKNKEKPSNFFVKDFAVSGEDFELQYDASLFLYKTYPQPNPEDLNRYYESKNYISHTDANKNWYFPHRLGSSYCTQSKRADLLRAIRDGATPSQIMELSVDLAWETRGVETKVCPF